MPTLWQIDLIPWYLFAAYWLIAWLHVKRTKTAEAFPSRLTTILPMVLGFELLCWCCDCDLGTILHRPVLEFPSQSQKGASSHSLGPVRVCSSISLRSFEYNWSSGRSRVSAMMNATLRLSS